jgi:hypothetical protein
VMLQTPHAVYGLINNNLWEKHCAQIKNTWSNRGQGGSAPLRGCKGSHPCPPEATHTDSSKNPKKRIAYYLGDFISCNSRQLHTTFDLYTTIFKFRIDIKRLSYLSFSIEFNKLVKESETP